MTIYIEGKVSEQQGAPDEGMVVDFSAIKHAWSEHLKPILDHKDLNEQFLFITTAENIAAWILVVLHDNGVPANAVDLWETESCCVHVEFMDVWGNEPMYRALTQAKSAEAVA